MATYLLDTSVIIDVLNGKRGRIALIEKLLRERNTLACCAINAAEVFAGMRPNEADATVELLRSLAMYDIDWAIARTAGELKFRHARMGRTLSLADTLIAAVALNNRLTLITDNVKDYPLEGLDLYPLT